MQLFLLLHTFRDFFSSSLADMESQQVEAPAHAQWDT